MIKSQGRTSHTPQNTLFRAVNGLITFFIKPKLRFFLDSIPKQFDKIWKNGPSRGIEPLPGDPQSPILATILRRPRNSKDSIPVKIFDFKLQKSRIDL